MALFSTKGGPGDPAAWAEFAAEDLRAARLSLEASPPLLRSACFHAHECAEKYLKGFLVSRGQTFPKVHDLEFLLEGCLELDASLQSAEGACDELNELVEPARYPADDVPKISFAKALRAIQLAAEIAELIAPKLK